jgi:hypothetical protein
MASSPLGSVSQAQEEAHLNSAHTELQQQNGTDREEQRPVSPGVWANWQVDGAMDDIFDHIVFNEANGFLYKGEPTSENEPFYSQMSPGKAPSPAAASALDKPPQQILIPEPSVLDRCVPDAQMDCAAPGEGGSGQESELCLLAIKLPPTGGWTKKEKAKICTATEKLVAWSEATPVWTNSKVDVTAYIDIQDFLEKVAVWFRLFSAQQDCSVPFDGISFPVPWILGAALLQVSKCSRLQGLVLEQLHAAPGSEGMQQCLITLSTELASFGDRLSSFKVDCSTGWLFCEKRQRVCPVGPHCLWNTALRQSSLSNNIQDLVKLLGHVVRSNGTSPDCLKTSEWYATQAVPATTEMLAKPKAVCVPGENTETAQNILLLEKQNSALQEEINKLREQIQELQGKGLKTHKAAADEGETSSSSSVISSSSSDDEEQAAQEEDDVDDNAAEEDKSASVGVKETDAEIEDSAAAAPEESPNLKEAADADAAAEEKQTAEEETSPEAEQFAAAEDEEEGLNTEEIIQYSDADFTAAALARGIKAYGCAAPAGVDGYSRKHSCWLTSEKDKQQSRVDASTEPNQVLDILTATLPEQMCSVWTAECSKQFKKRPTDIGLYEWASGLPGTHLTVSVRTTGKASMLGHVDFVIRIKGVSVRSWVGLRSLFLEE